ncbi:MAG TPA: polyprenyl synthetase family protein [Planctomycetaceae bacterium]|nr:polyprenyl synthetase family protein [Planctomycetaceae bacterium]
MRDEVAGGTGSHDLQAQVASLIGDELRQVEEIFWTELRSWHPYVTDVLSHLGGYRGKRLRPMLLLLAGQAAGEIDHDHRVLGAVVEMIHTATLVHDDVLDEATIRRHVATINSRWNNETSVLLGDYLFTHAFHLASSLESTLACRLIGRATNLVCEGELAQIHERGNLDLTEEQYFEIIEGKTAELCAICCFLGAHFSGAPKAVTEQLDAYGRALGIAFQIADDLLDVLGNEGETGKSLGSDYRKQKLTLPIIHLLNQADEAERNRLKALLGTPSEAARLEVVQAAERAGSIAYARARASEFAAAARSSLSCLPESPARQVLEDLTEFVTQRSA